MFNKTSEKNLGNTLKQHRLNANMTQEFVAQSLDVSRQAVSKWEKGTVKPSTNNLISLSNLYNVEIEVLLGNKSISPANKKVSKIYLISASSILIVISMLVILIYNAIYFSDIFIVDKSHLDSLTGKYPEIVCYDSVRECEKENGELFPEFFSASHIQTFNMTVIEHNKTLDIFLKDQGGICRIMIYKTDQDYPADKIFSHSLSEYDSVRKPILTVKQSKHSKGNYDSGNNALYIEKWYINNQFVIILSSSQKFLNEIRSKITD